MFQILLLLGSLLLHKQASLAAPLVKGNCTPNCGNISIPFPFGIGTGCFHDDWYEIICQESGSSSFPVLKKANLKVLNISLPDWYGDKNGMINVSLPIFYSSNASCGGNGSFAPVSLEGSQFVFSDSRNVFVAIGSNTRAFMQNTQSAIIGCESRCRADDSVVGNANCSGSDGCCQTTIITSDLQAFSVDFQVDCGTGGNNECNYAFLADRSQFVASTTDFNELRASGRFAAVLEWGIANASEVASQVYYNNSYYSGNDSFVCSTRSFSSGCHVEMPFLQCSCLDGFTGNPYIKDGCEDINECEDPNQTRCPDSCVNRRGSYECTTDATDNARRTDVKERATYILIGIGVGLAALGNLLLFSWWLYTVITKRREKRRETQLKEKYFKQNGGLLLQQELSSPEGNVEKSKLFNSKDLEKATDHFNKDRILGQGGQGTVYKGMLTDGKIVAIKKSEAIDEGKVEQFINEVLILSQISHRNIVRLLGCCLETEVPLLVYEFIPNGTLYQCLHEANEEFQVPWDTRLRVATEIAGALSYLHSAASIPIYHRDIKSTNILLDEKYRAKVADFGTSKSVSLDQTHVTTLVRGTFGYLDPEYFQTSQFTDKSDVYSFAVVLVELLTGRKPISPLKEEEGRNLVAYFMIPMEEDSVFDMVDAQVLKEGTEEEITAVADLARRCLNSIGRNRPMMKEVAMELERIRRLRNPTDFQQNRSTWDFQQDQEEVEVTESPDAIFTSSESYHVELDVTTFSDVQPFSHCETW